jgi:hypothetical protein
MRAALILYHLINILHLVFYALIFLSLVDLFNLGNLMTDYVYYLIGIYFVLYFGLNFLARQLGNGFANPITQLKWANWLHAGSVIVFALSFYLYYRSSHNYAYLMLISFPMDIFAVVMAYRAHPMTPRRSDMLDDFSVKNDDLT